MNQQEFTKAALDTEIVPERLNMSDAGLRDLMQVIISAAKLVDILKRPLIYGKSYTPEILANAVAAADDLSVNAASLRELIDSRVVVFGPGVTSSFAELVNKRLLHAAVGLFGEAGELMEALVKQGNGESLDMTNVAEELFDADWFLALGIDETGIPHQQIRDAGLAKLALRKQKKLQDQYANTAARDNDAERAAMDAYLRSKDEG